MTVLLGFNSGPSTLYLGEPEVVAASPVWPWVLLGVGIVVAIAVVIVVVSSRAKRAARSPAQRATDKLVQHHQVDAKARKALDRCASLLELKSPAGLLASPTALAEAISRCGDLKETDKSRLRELAIRIAQDRAGRSVSMTA
ncbi:MAG: hypothetical protein ACI89L_002048 [Phycisphaerales bacterium]|jgi:hypothetical protein